MMRWYVGVFALVMSFAAQAATVTQSHFPPGPTVSPGKWSWDAAAAYGSNAFDPPPPRTWTNGVYGGVKGVTALDNWTLNGKAGPLPVGRSIMTPLTSVGAALARCLGNPVCMVAGSFAWAGASAGIDALERLRVHKDPVDGTIKLDPGVAPASSLVWQYRVGAVNFGNAICMSNPYPKPLAAGVAAAIAAGPINAPCGIMAQPAERTDSPTSAGQTLNIGNATLGYGGTGYTSVVIAAVGVSSTSCPASVDPFNPAYNVPAGAPVGVDGKCPTARYNWAPITPENVGARLNTYDPLASPTDVGKLVEDFKDALAGGETAPGSTSNPMTGPATQTGTPTTTTTTTSTGGSKTETTTPTYTYNYGDTEITYNTTNTTVTVEGGVTTTTTTTSSPTPASDEEDFCKQHPDVLSCVKVTEPASTDPAWTERTVTYDEESLGFSGSCPPPVSWSLPNSGVVMEWSYQPACDVAPMIRLALLAIATIGAISIIIRETTA
jgi:hypothetical protein